MSSSVSHDGKNFEVSLAGLPPAPEQDLLSLLPSGGTATDGWLAAFGAELAAAAQDPERLEALLGVARSADREAALAEDAESRRAFTACGQITGALLDRARVSRPPFAALSEAGRMLLAIADVDVDGPTNEQIANASGLSTSQVSRTGARLARDGWAFSSRLGRMNAWTLTPNGARVAEVLRSSQASARPRSPAPMPSSATIGWCRSHQPFAASQGAVVAGMTRRHRQSFVAAKRPAGNWEIRDLSGNVVSSQPTRALAQQVCQTLVAQNGVYFVPAGGTDVFGAARVLSTAPVLREFRRRRRS